MRHLTIILITVLANQVSLAQNLKGVITDTKKHNPLPYATIIVNDTKNNFIKGTSTNDDGYFEIDISSGNYKIKVNFLGYKTHTSSITIAADSIREMNIQLEVDENLLDEVTLVAEKTTVEQLIDKKVVNVGKDILAAGGSAVTVLSQLSEVNTDENGNISLLGSQNVNILINGKPSPLSNAEILQQIPANEINKIEIITSPSVKYQANGLTGIVNIITKKKVRKGLKVNTNASVNSLLSHNIGGSLTYGKNKTNFRLGASLNKRNFENKNSTERTGLAPFSQKADFDFDGMVKRINAGIDWFPNVKNEFSTDINYTNNEHLLINESIISQNGVDFPQKTIAGHIHNTFDINANYRHLFDKENHFLEVDAQFSNNNNDLNANFFPNQSIKDNATKNTVLISNLAVDYKNKINDKVEIEAGYLWNYQVLDNELKDFDENNNVFNTTAFENKEFTQALYGLSKIHFSKVDLQIGLRGEVYHRKANLLSDTTTVENNFINLFPSLHINYKYHENLSLIFGYNRRTSRPSLGQVNPIVTQANEFTVHQGNPNLNPEFSNNFEISTILKKKGFSFTPSFFYRLKEGIIVHNFILKDNNTTIETYDNLGKSNAYGTALYFMFKPIKWIESNFDININFEKINAPNDDFINDLSKDYTIIFRNRIKASEKLKFDVAWNYYGPEESFYSTYKATHRINIGARYKIFKNGNLNLRFNDIFNTFMWRGFTIGENFTSTFEYKPRSRIVDLSFTYLINSGQQKQRNKKNRKYGSGVLD